MHAVIMAGGIGSRFWPRSRKERPKQLLDIISDQSMLRLTYERLKKLTDPNKIYIVAGAGLKIPIWKTCRNFRKKIISPSQAEKTPRPASGLLPALFMKKTPML